MFFLFCFIYSAMISSIYCFSWDYVTGLMKEYENYNKKFNEKNNQLEMGYFLRTPKRLNDNKVEENALVELISLVASEMITKPKLSSALSIVTSPELVDITTEHTENYADVLASGNIESKINSGESIYSAKINNDLEVSQSSVRSSAGEEGNESTDLKWLSYVPKHYSTINGVLRYSPTTQNKNRRSTY